MTYFSKVIDYIIPYFGSLKVEIFYLNWTSEEKHFDDKKEFNKFVNKYKDY